MISGHPICSFIILAVLSFGHACTGVRTDNSNRNSASLPVTEKAQGNVIRKDGNSYINEQGWVIPDLSQSIKETGKLKAKTRSGDNVTINIIKHDLTSMGLIDEPFKTVGLKRHIGRMRYGIKCELKGSVFCYQFQYQVVVVDENTGRQDYVTMVGLFSYYDEDGDGKFESLIFDEPSEFGAPLFGAPPHIPQWILNK